MSIMDLFHNPSSLKPDRFQTSIWAAKLVLMFIGVISILVLLKVAIIPYTFNLVLSTSPQLCASVKSWLSLPFIYIIVNFIIITIAASSNFHHKRTLFSDPHKHTYIPTMVSEIENSEPREEAQEIGHEEQEKEVEDFGLPFNKYIIESSLKRKQSNEPKEEEEAKEIEEEEEEEEVREVKEFGMSFNKFITHSSPFEKYSNDNKGSDDYDDDDDDDSMEATWRTIMEGEGKIKKPNLNKSETWGARISKAEPFSENGDVDDHVAWVKREFKKSETFNDRVSLRREKSMTPEELNQRAEHFIKMFNNQMKLQRLQSHQRFLDMVNGCV